MKLDLTTTFTDRNGRAIVKTGEESKGQVMTLSDVLMLALDWFEDPKSATGEQKYKRYKIIEKVKDGEDDFTVEEVMTMKEAVSAHPFVPFVHGQIVDLLDQKKPKLTAIKGGEKSGNT